MVPDIVGKSETNAISQGWSDLPAVISTTMVRGKIALPPPFFSSEEQNQTTDLPVDVADRS
jgi:hypothetical protein